jgi:hypothetical protein
MEKIALFKSNENKQFILRNIKLKRIIFSDYFVQNVIEYCNDLGYFTNIQNERKLPVISTKDHKKKLFIQEKNNNFILTNSIPIYDNSFNIIDHIIIEENLSDLLIAKSLYYIATQKNLIFPDEFYDNSSNFKRHLIYGIQYFNIGKNEDLLY